MRRRRRKLSVLTWADEGSGRRGQNNKDNMAVSFTVYSSTPETLYKAIRFCLLGLSFHSSHRSGVSKHKSHLCVFCWFLRTPERPGLAGWMGGSKFLHFTEAYIIFLLPVKQNVFSTGSLVLVMVKKTKKKVRNKKSSGPEHDNADSATSPPSCWSAGF